MAPNLQATPTVEAERAADVLERDDNKPWDEDFKLALMLAFDRFAAERLTEHSAALRAAAEAAIDYIRHLDTCSAIEYRLADAIAALDEITGRRELVRDS